MTLGRSMLAAPLVLAGACLQDPVAVYRDVPVVADGPGAVPLDGTPAIRPGIYKDAVFVAYEPGDDLVLIDGVQGGRWVHVSIRVVAMRREGRLDLLLRRDGPGGERIAQASYAMQLTPTDDGALEAYDVPLPIPLSEAATIALAGVPAHLAIAYASGDRSASASLPLVFAPE